MHNAAAKFDKSRRPVAARVGPSSISYIATSPRLPRTTVRARIGWLARSGDV